MVVILATKDEVEAQMYKKAADPQDTLIFEKICSCEQLQYYHTKDRNVVPLMSVTQDENFMRDLEAMCRFRYARTGVVLNGTFLVLNGALSPIASPQG